MVRYRSLTHQPIARSQPLLVPSTISPESLHPILPHLEPEFYQSLNDDQEVLDLTDTQKGRIIFHINAVN
jgi:hypothetical protein